MAGKKGKKLKKRMGRALRWGLVLLIIAVFALSIYWAVNDINPFASLSAPAAEEAPAPTPAPEAAPACLRVYMIDVGQGDCMLMISPSGRTMLIDSGEGEYFTTVYSFLRGLGVSRLDAIVATHPHSDHIGGMAELIRAFEVGAMYMPEADGLSQTYEDMLAALSDKNIQITLVCAESTPVISWDDDVAVTVLSPFEDIAYAGLNDYSIIMRAEYGDTSMLFTGDAEGEARDSAEYALLARTAPEALRSDILKVGHHGSFTSTSDAFLAAVSPDYAMIPVGKNNEYGHPSPSVLARLEAAGVRVYRTDTQGHLLAELDGEGIEISPVSAKSESLEQMLGGVWDSVKELWRTFTGIFK